LSLSTCFAGKVKLFH